MLTCVCVPAKPAWLWCGGWSLSGAGAEYNTGMSTGGGVP